MMVALLENRIDNIKLAVLSITSFALSIATTTFTILDKPLFLKLSQYPVTLGDIFTMTTWFIGVVLAALTLYSAARAFVERKKAKKKKKEEDESRIITFKRR